MALIDYTTYAECRAALGTNDKEIDDVVLVLPMYALGLVADLEDISSTLVADYTTIAALTANVRTAAQQAVYDAVRLFAPYSVASLLASSLPMFAPKQITDGKAGMTRDSSAPYKEAIKDAKTKFDRFRARLLAKYTTFKSNTSIAAVALPLMRVSSPTSDPIAG